MNAITRWAVSTICVVLGVTSAIVVGAASQDAKRTPLDELARTVVPIGGVIPYFGDPAMLPDSWQLCDGQPLREHASPLLKQQLGGNTPNLAKRVVYGAGDGIELNKPFGDATHKHSMSHTHSVGAINISVSNNNVGVGGAVFSGGATKSGGRGDGIRNGANNGDFVWACDEDTMWASFRDHTHTFNLTASGTVPAHDTGGVRGPDETGEAAHYPPGIGAHWIMRIR